MSARLLAPVVALALAASLAAAGSSLVDPPSIAGGKFEVTCRYSHSGPADEYFHDFFGNKDADQNTPAADLVGEPTTCLLRQDSASYWSPAAYRSDTGARVLPKKVWAYYFGTPGVTEAHFPAGLELAAGNDEATGPSEADHIAFSCGNGMGDTHSPVRPYPYNCKTDPDVVGSVGVVAIVRFPYCWDGTGNQPSDVTYPDPAGDGSCPAYTLPQLQIHEHFGVGPGDPTFSRGDLLTFSSGGWFTFHGNFVNGWRQPKLNALVDGCQNAPNLNCGFLTDDNPGPKAGHR